MKVLSHGINPNITHIIHIADIHVRNGNKTQARILEYKHVFDNFIKDVNDLECVKNKTSVTVICGDIFHNKGKIESEGALIIFDFINNLLKLTPVFIICGNHDFRQEDPEYTDMIDMLVKPYTNGEHIYYLKNTDHYIWENIGFGVVSVKDTLVPFSASGIIRELPDYTNPNHFPDYVQHKIALFHGTICQSALPTGKRASSYMEGYALNWFKGYDYVMLGDNHKQQLHLSDIKWGYPGSLICQDFGEHPYDHGYILWNLPEGNASIRNIKNDYTRMTMIINDLGNIGILLPDRSVVYVNNKSEYPKYPLIRVNDKHYDVIIELSKLWGNEPKFVKTSSNRYTYNAVHEEKEYTNYSNLISVDIWVKYVKEKLPDFDKFQYLTHVDNFLFNTECTLPEHIKTKMKNKNKEITKCIEKYKEETENIKVNRYDIKLKYMNWSYIMCYGEDCYIDFDNLDESITLLNGRNASGKSSLFDTICIGLFGEPTLMRTEYNGNGLSSMIIHNNKPNETKYSSYVSITFSIGEKVYEIYRSFTNQGDDKKHSKIEKIFEIKDDSKTVIAEKSKMVNEWVNEKFGDLQNMMINTMICQNDNNNFFTIKTEDQFSIIDKALKIDVLSLYEDLIKRSFLDYKLICNEIETYIEGLKDVHVEEVDIEALNKAKEELEKLTDELNKKEEILKMLAMIIHEPKEMVRLEDAHEILDYHKEELEKLPEYDLNELIINKGKLVNEKERLIELRDEKKYGDEIREHCEIGEEPVRPKHSLEYMLKELDGFECDIDEENLKVYLKELHDELSICMKKIPQVVEECDLDEDYECTIEQLWNMIDYVNKKIANHEKYRVPQCDVVDYAESSLRHEELKKEYESLLKNKIGKPLQQGKNIEIYDGIEKNLEYIKNNSIIPVKQEKEYHKWKKKYADWKESMKKLPSETYETLVEQKKKLQKTYDLLDISEDKYKDMSKKINEIEKDIESLEKIPYNPKCEACKKNYGPTMKRLEEKKGLLIEYVKQKNELKEVIMKCKKETDGFDDKIKKLDEEIKIRKIYEEHHDMICKEKLEWDLAKKQWKDEKDRIEKIKDIEWSLYVTWFDRFNNIEKQYRYVEYERYREWLEEYENLQIELHLVKYKLWKEWNNYVNELKDEISVYDDMLKKSIIEKEMKVYEVWSRWNELCHVRDNNQWIHDMKKVEIELNELEKKLDICEARMGHIEFIKEMENLINYSQYKDTENDVRVLRIKVKDVGNYVATNEVKYKAYMEKNQNLENVGKAYSEINETYTVVKTLKNIFIGDSENQGFKVHLYKEIVLPLLMSKVNEFLEKLDNFSLDIEYRKNKLIYFIKDRGNRPSIDHASGYQKFLINLAMRSALASIGAVGQNIKHLFLDEGFVACDSTNILKVGDILKELMNMTGYKSIILMSHLDQIREIAHKVINIERDELSKFSYIRYGKVVNDKKKIKK